MLTLIFAIGFLLTGVYLSITAQMSPLNILCFVFGGIFGVCFLIRCVKKAIWKIIRKPLYIVLVIALIAMLITLIPIKLCVASQPEEACDYLIVLGCKVENTEPSSALQDRINTAYDYLARHPYAICIASGGQADKNNISEAQCIYNELTAMGISSTRIWIEDRATSTSENFAYSLELIEEKTGAAPDSVAVVSNDFHLLRSSLIAKDNDLDAVFVAAPTTGTGTRIGYTIREIFALWKYLLIGD